MPRVKYEPFHKEVIKGSSTEEKILDSLTSLTTEVGTSNGVIKDGLGIFSNELSRIRRIGEIQINEEVESGD